MASTPYSKPATSVTAQIQLLIQRGLIIDNVADAEHYLTHIGFYRLAGYWLHLQDDPILHTFRQGTNFLQALELYEFDRDLRALLLDAIERIEVSLKAVISNEMARAYTPTWYCEDNYAYNLDALDEILSKIDEEIVRRKNDDFVKHHINTYGKDQPMPSWKVMEILSLGTLSKLYGNIHKAVPKKKDIAKIFGLPDDLWLENYTQVLTILRNLCAHHSRVCLTVFSIPPKLMNRKTPLKWILGLPTPGTNENRSVYYQLCVVAYLLQTASPIFNFSTKLKQVLTKYPGVDRGKMGFYTGWENEPLWQ